MFLSNLRIFSLFLASVVLLAGCAHCKPGYIKKREVAYLSSCEAPPLRVPNCFSSMNIGCDYMIPSVSGPRPTCPVDITPPDLTCR